MGLSFNDYQKQALRTAVYPCIGRNLTYPILGLVGEAGEVANKFKKILRDDGGTVTAEKRQQILDEVGDCIWYLAMICHEMGYNFASVAASNLSKLRSRQEVGALHGSGDKR